jgi:hypothetical protein
MELLPEFGKEIQYLLHQEYTSAPERLYPFIISGIVKLFCGFYALIPL